MCGELRPFSLCFAKALKRAAQPHRMGSRSPLYCISMQECSTFRPPSTLAPLLSFQFAFLVLDLALQFARTVRRLFEAAPTLPFLHTHWLAIAQRLEPIRHLEPLHLVLLSGGLQALHTLDLHNLIGALRLIRHDHLRALGT